jgi:hypothetical protein
MIFKGVFRMKKWISLSPGFAISVMICLVGVFAMPQPGFCDSQDDDEISQPSEEDYTPDVRELRMRADADVREVNEATQAEVAQAEAVKRNRYNEELGYVPTGKVLSDDELAAFEKQRAEKEQAVRAKVGYKMKSLETQQAPVPASSTTESKRPLIRPRLPVAKFARGLVGGIVFCDNKGAALLDGEVVRENDEVMGIRITRILPGYVEFEKQGKKWRQLVGQTPPASWGGQSSPDAQNPTTTPKTDTLKTKTKK